MFFDSEKITKKLLTVNDIINIVQEYRPNNILHTIDYNCKGLSISKPMQLALDSTDKKGAVLEMNYDKLTKDLLCTYDVELCNALIILYMFHEFEHVRALELFQKDSLDSYDYLVKTSMLQCDLLPGTYERKHDAFLSEFNANTMSLKHFLDEFSSIFSKETIQLLNKDVAYNLYRGYILIPDNFDFIRNKIMFKSPIKRVLNLNRSIFEFQKIKKAISNTSDLGLLYGGDITFSDIEKIRNISGGKQKTLNIFDDIK